MYTAPHGRIAFDVSGYFPCWSSLHFEIDFESFWLVWGSTFGALGCQKVIGMLSKIDAKIGIEESKFRGGPDAS